MIVHTPHAGTKFGTNAGSVTVKAGDADCDITTVTDTSLECVLGTHSAGSVPISLSVDGLGKATGDFEFEYELKVLSVSLSEGESNDRFR